MKLTTLPFAAVRWGDAHCLSGTSEVALHELPQGPAIYTRYGFILRRDEKGIILASEESENSTYRSVDFIPAQMIIEVQPIRLSKMKSKGTPPVYHAEQSQTSDHSE